MGSVGEQGGIYIYAFELFIVSERRSFSIFDTMCNLDECNASYLSILRYGIGLCLDSLELLLELPNLLFSSQDFVFCLTCQPYFYILFNLNLIHSFHIYYLS